MSNRTKKTLWLLAFAVFLAGGVFNIVLPFMFTRILGAFAVLLSVICMYAYIRTKGTDAAPRAENESPEDKLLRYKHLLDEGAITLDEYMEKKRQILSED